ncbi:hypothetical protein, partial [Saccharopolyspora kobensis]|uniref:hypothetical protein n=1 Tax=Saccharopolyspora kobensis TaxID=146035 RepID=UPI00332FE6F6
MRAYGSGGSVEQTVEDREVVAVRSLPRLRELRGRQVPDVPARAHRRPGAVPLPAGLRQPRVEVEVAAPAG